MAERIGQLTLQGKPLKIHDWPKDDDTKELTDALLKIDPSYSSDVRSFSQLKSTFPLLYEFVLTHCFFHDYLTEITICEDKKCKFCLEKFSRGVCTPDKNDGILRATVLAPMLRPEKDPSDQNHYIKPELTRKFISDHHLSFEDIENELP